MIVRETAAALQLITQPDHAALARRIMDHWTADGLPDSPRRPSILHAIGEHDNGWREVDAAPIVDASSGKIADFISAPAEVRRGVWPRGVGRLSADPWAAALVAQHAIHIYARYNGDSEWRPFFAEMARLRAFFVDRADGSLDTLLADYLFLRIGDLLSLAFCNEWTDDLRHDRYAIRYLAPNLAISPDPFDGHPLPLEIAARELPRHAYRDAAAARTAWDAAHRVTLTGTLSMARDPT